MNSEKLEKMFLLMLAFIFLIGGFFLHKKHTKPLKVIKIEQKGSGFLLENKIKLDKENRININTASLSEITGIPGIGKSIAGNIIKRRDLYGRIFNREELLKVDGIGKKKLNQVLKYIVFD